MLGQVHIKDKSNEITAIPELVELLNLNGCLITIDAMGCQKKIAEKIIEKKRRLHSCCKEKSKVSL